MKTNLHYCENNEAGMKNYYSYIGFLLFLRFWDILSRLAKYADRKISLEEKYGG